MYNSKTEPREYQAKALKKALLKRKFALLMDPGTGKTKVGVDFMGTLFTQNELHKVLVVAPVLAMGVWEDEMEKHLDDHIPFQFFYVEGNQKHRKQAITNACNASKDVLTILMISYDSAYNYRAELADYNAELYICDESHYVKNHTSKRSMAITSLISDVPNRLLLTGTPMPRNPLDMYSQLNIMGIEGRNWHQFRYSYAIYGGYMKKQIIKWKNLDALKHLIKENSIRVSKDALGLPKLNEIIIPVRLDDETKRLYNEFAKEMIAEYGDHTIVASIPIVKAMKLKQITGGFTKDDEGHMVKIGHEKADACEELLQQLVVENHEKVVVFAHYKHEIKTIAEIVKKLGYTPLLIYGGVSREDRDRFRKAFQTSDQYPVIICQLAAGGLGIDLFAARYEIFYSQDRQSDHYTQCIGRVYRTGQERPVFVYHLIVKNSIDQLVYKSNKAKVDLAEYLSGKEIKLL